MQKTTFNLIQDATTFLQTKHARKYRDYLRTPLVVAVDIIVAVENANVPLTVADIAMLAGLSVDTVADTIRALRQGGYPFVIAVAGTQGHKYLVSL